ncbi:hypothetical protein B0H13DRAFT_1924264 [Mycena leptocephala]|nr:hypothetical protein B0H13DRAFT_1924264 [Mycena leptocephala]
MPCGAYADDRVTPPLVPTQHASPTNSIMQSASDARPGRTTTLPPLKERPMPTMSLYPHHKRANARKGILAGDSATTWDAAMDVIQTPSTKNDQHTTNGNEPVVLGGAPAAIGDRLATTQNVPLNAEAAATQSPTVTATMQDGPLNIEATDHSQAATTTTQDGPFDADVFLNGVDNNDPPPSPRILAAAAPSTSRTMRKQIESFDSRTDVEKSKEKSKSTGSPLDSALKGFSETDLVYYNHIGLTPPVCGDSAAAFRERVTQNEMKTNLLDALPSTEFYDEIEELTTNVEELQKKANDADRVEVCTEIAALKELAGTTNPPAAVSSAFTPAPPVTAANKPWRPRIRVKKPIVYSSFPSPVADEPADRTLRTGANFPMVRYRCGTCGKHGHNRSTCSDTRHMQSSAPAPLVIYSTFAGAPLVDQVPQSGQSYAAAPAMAGAFAGVQPVTQSVAGFIPPSLTALSRPLRLTLRNAGPGQVARGHANKISIRFRSRKKADAFASLVQRFTPIPGQTAFHSEAPTHGGTSAGP